MLQNRLVKEGAVKKCLVFRYAFCFVLFVRTASNTQSHNYICIFSVSFVIWKTK